NKYRTKVVKEINDYCKKIGFDMAIDVIMDLSFVGKAKEKYKKDVGDNDLSKM
ncbi:unnamed protein product, partial [marine sediment metagenome]